MQAGRRDESGSPLSAELQMTKMPSRVSKSNNDHDHCREVHTILMRCKQQVIAIERTQDWKRRLETVLCSLQSKRTPDCPPECDPAWAIPGRNHSHVLYPVCKQSAGEISSPSLTSSGISHWTGLRPSGGTLVLVARACMFRQNMRVAESYTSAAALLDSDSSDLLHTETKSMMGPSRQLDVLAFDDSHGTVDSHHKICQHMQRQPE